MAGEEVDHIVPLSRGGAEQDPANLQHLCVPCHAAKTRREQGGDQSTRRLRHGHQGRLTDVNGEKLTDLSGITFAAPIAEGFDLLADKIQLLIITLGGPSGLSQAVEDMVDSAALNIKDLAGEWSGMTDAMKTEFSSFAAFVEERALREMAADAGLNYDAIKDKWAGMTDDQKAKYDDFKAYVDEKVLDKMVTDAGGDFEAMRTTWETMTDDQKAKATSFKDFVNGELDQIQDKTVTVTTQYRTEGAPAGAGVAADDSVFARHGTPFRQFGHGTPALLHGLERVMTGREGRGIAAALARIQQGLGAIAALSGVHALATGTPGLGFQDFGAGSLAVLHGREAVVPQSRAADFAAQHADMRGLAREVQGLREDLARADQRFATTLRSVLAKA